MESKYCFKHHGVQNISRSEEMAEEKRGSDQESKNEVVAQPSKHANNSKSLCSSSTIEISSREAALDRNDAAVKGSATINTMNDPQNMSSIEQKNPSTPFSTLWLPFKSPFRRPFFFPGNKTGAQNNFDGCIEGQHEDVPMAMAGSLDRNRCYLKLEEQQQISWLHPNSLGAQHEPEATAMTCMDHGDVPILQSKPLDRNDLFKTSDLGHHETSNLSDVVHNCCGIMPPFFQTAHQNELSSARVDDDTTNSVVQNLSDSKKQGSIPTRSIRLTDRCRSESFLCHKEQRQLDHQRLSHKKQRAAHQASSPANNASLPRHGSLERLTSNGHDSSPPPTVRYINDRKVTIIDEELKIFVVDLLTPETCELVRRMTDNHVKQVKESGCNIATWRTLYTYTKRDLPCSEVKGLTSRVTDHIMASIIDTVGKIHGNEQGASKLHPRSWKEPHLLLYQKFKNETPHTGVEMHYDGCDITWNCMLSKSSDYEGGGTYIRALRKTVRLEQGQILVHPGELYHKGCDITSGERALIVCFMDGFDPQIVDSSSTQEDNEIYESNVHMYV